MNHLGTKVISTERLILRPYVLSDAEALFRNWVTDPEVSRFWGWEPHEHIGITRSLLGKWIQAYENPDHYHWVILWKETNEAIGYLYLNDIDEGQRSAAVHYLLSRTFWSQGIMTEACRSVIHFAFEEVGFLRIHSHHHVENPASGRVMEKSGLRYLETKHRQMDSEALSGDYCYYEILRPD